MTIEALLADHAAALREHAAVLTEHTKSNLSLAAAMGAAVGAAQAGAVNPTPAKEVVPAAAPVVAQPVAAPVVAQPVIAQPVAQPAVTGLVAGTVTIEQVRGALQMLAKEQGKDAAVGLVTGRGAENVSSLKPEDYAAVYAAASEMLTKGKDPLA